MSHPAGSTPALLPVTQQLVERKQADTARTMVALGALFDALEVPPPIVVSALTSFTLTLLVRLQLPPAAHADLSVSMRGFAEALLAYTESPDHATALERMVAAVERANQTTVDRLDTRVAAAMPKH